MATIRRIYTKEIEKMEKELQKLGRFHMPSNREMQVMEFLYKPYRQSGKNVPSRTRDIWQELNIPDGQDVSTVSDSRYFDRGMNGTYETIKFSPDGIRYMDNFYGLTLRNYEEQGGKIENGEMITARKKSNAKQWAKGQMSGLAQQSANSNDVVILEPNLYGIGVNLRSLWKKIKAWF